MWSCHANKLVGCRSVDQRRQALVAQTGHGPSRSRNEPSGYSGGRAGSRRAGHQEPYDRSQPTLGPAGTQRNPADDRPAEADRGSLRARQHSSRPPASRRCGGGLRGDWAGKIIADDARADEARKCCSCNADGVFGRHTGSRPYYLRLPCPPAPPSGHRVHPPASAPIPVLPSVSAPRHGPRPQPDLQSL